MELRQYITILRRRKWVIFGTTLLIATLAALYSFLATPMYTSSTTLRIATVTGGGIGGYPDVVYSDRLINTYARVVTGANVMGEVMEQLNLTDRPSISAEVIPNTELMRIEAQASTPEMAQAVAEMAGALLIKANRDLYVGEDQSTLEIISDQIAQIEKELGQLRSEYDSLVLTRSEESPQVEGARQAIVLKEQTYATLLDQYEKARVNETIRANSVSIVDAAYLPVTPSQPKRTLNLILGISVGALLGTILALTIENLDTTLYTPGQIESVTKASPIGRIPISNNQAASTLMFESSANGSVLEAYRRLRISLLSMNGPSGHLRTFVVTSATTGEGKSTVTANLAVSFAKSGRTVIVVDADLYQPVQHEVFRVSNEIGLTDILSKQAGVSGVVQKADVPNLYVIARGRDILQVDSGNGYSSLVPSGLADHLKHGSELLGSPQMAALINQLIEEYDIVLIDTPALLSVTDAAVLAPLVDNVVLVVASERSQRESVRIVREQLENVNARSVSVVINQDRTMIGRPSGRRKLRV